MFTTNAEYVARKRRLQYRGMKYCLLSILLTIMLVLTSGCAALLVGKEKIAYQCLVKASTQFYYPSSVQIKGGCVVGDSLYCTIRAKNKMGYYGYDTYYISNSGYVMKDESSLCSSSKLNYESINNALAVHFDGSLTTMWGAFTGYLAGGMYQMETSYIVIALFVLLVLNVILSSKASDMAMDKGYEKSTWFHMCFWIGPISYIIVAAMPDRVMQSKIDMTNDLLQRLLIAHASSSQTAEKKQKANTDINLPEL